MRIPHLARAASASTCPPGLALRLPDRRKSACSLAFLPAGPAGTPLAQTASSSKRLQETTEDIMKSIIGIIGIATLALVGLSTPALAQGSGPCDIKSEPCLAALHLSRYQERQVESFRAAAFRQARQVQAQIDRVEDELRLLTWMRHPNPNAIARKQAEQRALRDREQGIWMTYRAQVESVLYPMQRATWARCTNRGPAPALVRPVGPVRQAPPSRVVVVQTRSPRPMGRR
jgi:hypothetical protein